MLRTHIATDCCYRNYAVNNTRTLGRTYASRFCTTQSRTQCPSDGALNPTLVDRHRARLTTKDSPTNQAGRSCHAPVDAPRRLVDEMHSRSASSSSDASRCTLMKGTWRPLKSRKRTKAAVLETLSGQPHTGRSKHDILES